MHAWTSAAARVVAPSSRRRCRLLLAGALALPGCGVHSEADALALARQEIQARDYATAIVRLPRAA